MKLQIVLFCILLNDLQFPCQCFCDELDVGIASYFLQKADIDQKMSVNIEATYFTDLPPEKGNQDQTLGLGAILKYQRLIVANNGSVQRLDAKVTNLLSKKEPIDGNQECQLLLENECLYVNYRVAPETISRYEVRAGVVPMKTSSRRKHPLDLPVSQHNDCLFEKPTGIFYHRGSVIHEEVLSDARKRVVMISDNKLGAWEIVFASNPEWLPEQVRFIARFKVPLPKDGKITVEQVGKWTPVAKTTTSWKKHIDLPYWLPSSVRMEATDSGMDQTREFLFDNWQFGMDVDSELLRKANFKPELIQNQVDFKAIINNFENIRAASK